MTWLSTLIGVAALVLFVRSTRLLQVANPPADARSFGWMSLLVAVVAVILHVLVARGRLVISPEFGVVMVQGGTIAQYGLSAMLLATGLVGALGWYVSRMRAGHASRQFLFIVLGAAIGAVAVCNMRPVNPEDVESLRIYLYGLWSPPLLLWLAACFTACGLVEPLKLRGPLRILVIALALALTATLAQFRPEIAGSGNGEIWRVVSLIMTSSAWVIAGWLAVPWRLWGDGFRHSAVKAAVPVTGGILGFLLAQGRGEAWAGATGQVLLLFAWPLLLGGLHWRAFYHRFFVDLTRVTARGWGMLVSLVAIALSMAEIFYLGGIASSIALATFLFAWVVFSELLHPGALGIFFERVAAGKLIDDTQWHSKWEKFTSTVGKVWSYLGTVFKTLFSAQSFPMALLKLIGGVLLLVAMAEIPNAGKTVVLALQTPAGDAYKGIGQAIADQVANSVAAQSQELISDSIVLRTLKEGSSGTQATSHASNTMDAALAKNSDLKLGDLTIPLGAIAAPIQAPTRMLLGVRVVSGSLHENREGYRLLAESTAGDSWRVDLPRRRTFRSNEAAAQSQSADASCGGARSEVGSPAQSGTSELSPADAVPVLAEELAFRIRATDPKLATPSMTRSWDAFESFRAGLRHWRCFEASGSFDELGRAISEFRNAVRIDPTFALAHYRLGLALQKDGQPALAVEALRASLRASRDHPSTIAALATTLWDFDSFYYRPGAGFYRNAKNREAEKARRAEARDLWQQMVQSSAAELDSLDQSSANYGLCLHAFETRNAALQSQASLANTRKDMSVTVGSIHDAAGALEQTVNTVAGEPSETIDALISEVQSATKTLDAANETLGRARDLLAGAAIQSGELSSRIDEVNRSVQAARKSLGELHRTLGQRGRRTSGQLRKLQVSAAQALRSTEQSMSGLIKGAVGAGLGRAVELYRIQADDRARMTYFYCKRVEELSARLPKQLRSIEAMRRAEGLALNMLGVLLEDVGPAATEAKRGWHCRQTDYTDASDEEDATGGSYPRGPYAWIALRYYQRAAALLPENPEVRCSGARVARAMGDEQPMNALSGSADARARLGSEFLDQAQSLDAGQSGTAAQQLRRAMDEFREAIQLEPNHVDSLNEFAYTAWQLQWLKNDEYAPDAALLSDAERYARTAVALTSSGFQPDRRVMVQATLGEVLLARNRSHEAVEVLRSAQEELHRAFKAGADHAAFHEARWDLAQAALCAAAIDERSGFLSHARQLREEAANVLTAIQKSERQREVALFVDTSAPNSLRMDLPTCNAGILGESGDFGGTGFRLVASTHNTAGHLVCDRNWVKGRLRKRAEATDGLELEVWGGGVQISRKFLSAHRMETDEMAFSDRLQDTHLHYFARLTESGVPRSAVLPLATFASKPGARCSRNLLVLEFDSDASAHR